MVMVMDPIFTLNYVGCWAAMCPGPLGLDELDNINGGEATSQPLEEDN